MNSAILGLHHITAIAGDAQRNHDFYTQVLGLRLVKKTVNFDDPGTYHFYYGNETGAPGTILTFFPWQHVKQGKAGAGMATEICYAVPAGSLPFWKERFRLLNVSCDDVITRLGETLLPFRDPDGLQLALVENETDDRPQWISASITAAQAIKGFHSVVLTVNNAALTAHILKEIFGYKLTRQEGNLSRYATQAIGTANYIDILEIPSAPRGINAGGTNHHIAFRVKDEQVLMEYRQKIIAEGYSITEKIDRNYFYSLYFREPNGVLFEIATDNPGFDIDESLAELGKNLKLPAQYEPIRKRIEDVLPQLK